MKFEILVLITVISSRKVFPQDVLYGSECANAPIKCVNSTSFAFCTVINGEEKLVGYQHCLKGQTCSESNEFKPCTEDATTTTIKTPISPPNCEETGSGNFPAPKCNQYYECSKTLWWWDAKLKTCSKNTAFEQASNKCVPIQQTMCDLTA